MVSKRFDRMTDRLQAFDKTAAGFSFYEKKQHPGWSAA